jgi:hypothetical protein
MESACSQENKSRFSQLEATPPMQEPKVSELGYLGDTPAERKSCKTVMNLQKEQTGTRKSFC